METLTHIDGQTFAKMVQAGTVNLKNQAQEINDLNVFPIPDGDTGDNMLMTMMGGAEAAENNSELLGEASRKIADGMLLSARGNSGVILSQFFDGIAKGFEGIDVAENEDILKAFKCGVKQAYSAVMEPTEGTILTVARKATEYVSECDNEDIDSIFQNFLSEAKNTLNQTPEMLPVLKKAGVVDSGGAGLIYIIEGMTKALTGSFEAEGIEVYEKKKDEIDINLFTENDVLVYGYCTELLLRLQTSKTDPENFDISVITDFLKDIGDSVVAFKTGTAVKIHVHTKTPDKVMAFCQQYGEFLKVKIENMSLQHNNTDLEDSEVDEEKKKFSVVSVCAGEGIKEMFLSRGADVIVDGGQSMNPSTEDFLSAFDKANAETIFVLPNNGNVILAAKQAANMYKKSDVRVIESHSIGEGYSALSMYCDVSDADSNMQDMIDAMAGTVTACVSKSCRDTEETKNGDYIGFSHKDILSSDSDRFKATKDLVDKIISDNEICILVYGKEANLTEAEKIQSYIEEKYSGKEVYLVDGKQDIYDYILIME